MRSSSNSMLITGGRANVAAAGPTLAAVVAVRVRDKDVQGAVTHKCNGSGPHFHTWMRQLDSLLDRLNLLAYARGTVSVLVQSYTIAGSILPTNGPYNGYQTSPVPLHGQSTTRQPTPASSEDMTAAELGGLQDGYDAVPSTTDGAPYAET